MVRVEANPVAEIRNGKLELIGEPYDSKTYTVCKVYGEMSDGTKVWADEDGNQYTRNKYFGKFFFVKL